MEGFGFVMQVCYWCQVTSTNPALSEKFSTSLYVEESTYSALLWLNATLHPGVEKHLHFSCF